MRWRVKTGVRVDFLNNVTTMTYDALNRLVQTVDPNYGVTKFQYDKGDALVRVEDSRALVTTYVSTAWVRWRLVTGRVREALRAQRQLSAYRTLADPGRQLAAAQLRHGGERMRSIGGLAQLPGAMQELAVLARG